VPLNQDDDDDERTGFAHGSNFNAADWKMYILFVCLSVHKTHTHREATDTRRSSME
jgi:hypothetical protein